VEKTSYLCALQVWLVCVLTLSFVLVMERPLMESIRRGIDKGSLVKEQKDFFKEVGRK
jgi:hypothetical protein